MVVYKYTSWFQESKHTVRTKQFCQRFQRCTYPLSIARISPLILLMSQRLYTSTCHYYGEYFVYILCTSCFHRHWSILIHYLALVMRKVRSRRGAALTFNEHNLASINKKLQWVILLMLWRILYLFSLQNMKLWTIFYYTILHVQLLALGLLRG